MLTSFGKERVHWAMMFIAFWSAFPLFFEIGFVLLAAARLHHGEGVEDAAGEIAIPLLAGLSVVHGLVPPHPGPLLAIGIFKPTRQDHPLRPYRRPAHGDCHRPAVRQFHLPLVITAAAPELAAQLAPGRSEDAARLGITPLTVLLPVLLML